MCKIDSKTERVFDEGIELKDNAMLKIRPELFYEWNFELNDELGLDIYKVTYGSHKIAWWTCPRCKSEYDMIVCYRAGNKKANCPYCAGKRVNNTNSLGFLYSSLAKEWHPTKNGGLTVHDVASNSGKKVWWECEKNHEWETCVSHRTSMRSNCPYCSNQKLLIGFNDMWTTNPELAAMLADPEDGYRYMQFSNKRVDWKCLDCEQVIKNRIIGAVSIQGLSCSRCSDGISFNERFLHNLLKEFGLSFIYDKSQSWSENKRYDFYLPDYNWIIETHGRQHYRAGLENMGGRTLKEEQENDILKEKLAKENGIDKYIVIDCRYSTVEWIKNSIINSELKDIINLNKVDWEEIGKISSRSLIKEVCDLWNNGAQDISFLSKSIKISYHSIYNYLKRGAEIGWCDYCPNYSNMVGAKKRGIAQQKEIIQLTLQGEIIKEWSSAKESSNKLSIHNGSISLVCRNIRNRAGGFKWMYKSDYDHMLSLNISHEEYMNTYYPQPSKSASKSKQ